MTANFNVCEPGECRMADLEARLAELQTRYDERGMAMRDSGDMVRSLYESKLAAAEAMKGEYLSRMQDYAESVTAFAEKLALAEAERDEQRDAALALVEKWRHCSEERDRFKSALERIIKHDKRLPDFTDNPQTLIASEALKEEHATKKP